jgi:thymidylate kinase
LPENRLRKSVTEVLIINFFILILDRKIHEARLREELKQKRKEEEYQRKEKEKQKKFNKSIGQGYGSLVHKQEEEKARIEELRKMEMVFLIQK